MSVYVVLEKMTHTAIENAKGFSERDAKAEQIIKAAGGTLLAHSYTFGRYDFVVIVEIPSESAMVKLLVDLGHRITISTETLTAMSPKIIYNAVAGR
jgi:uncharacterized protein with GYD domain